MQEKRIASYKFYSQYYSDDQRLQRIIVYPKDYRQPVMFRACQGKWFRACTVNNYEMSNARYIDTEETKALEEEFSEIIKQQIAELNDKQPFCLHLDGEIINKITRKENDKWIDIFFGYSLDESYGKIAEERLLELKRILTESEIQVMSSFLEEELTVEFPEILGYVATKDFKRWRIESEKFEGILSTEFSNLIKDRITPKSMIEPLTGYLHSLQRLCTKQQNKIESLESQMNDLIEWVNKSPFLD